MKKTNPLWCLSVATSLEAEDAVAELLGFVTGGAAAAYYNLESGRELGECLQRKTLYRHPPR